MYSAAIAFHTAAAKLCGLNSVNGVMLPDISGEEVEQYLLKQGLVGTSEKQVGVPINAPCSDAQHAAMAMGQQPSPVNLIKN